MRLQIKTPSNDKVVRASRPADRWWARSAMIWLLRHLPILPHQRLALAHLIQQSLHLVTVTVRRQSTIVRVRLSSSSVRSLLPVFTRKSGCPPSRPSFHPSSRPFVCPSVRPSVHPFLRLKHTSMDCLRRPVPSPSMHPQSTLRSPQSGRRRVRPSVRPPSVSLPG